MSSFSPTANRSGRLQDNTDLPILIRKQADQMEEGQTCPWDCSWLNGSFRGSQIQSDGVDLFEGS